MNEYNAHFYEKIKANPQIYSGVSLRDKVPKEREKYFRDDLVDLLEKMLVFDPEDRITMAEVLEHPFFDRVKTLPKVGQIKYRMKQLKSRKITKVPADNLR